MFFIILPIIKLRKKFNIKIHIKNSSTSKEKIVARKHQLNILKD